METTPSPVKKLVGKYWFFVGIGVVILAAFKFPVLRAVIEEWKLLKVGIFLSFLITGLTLRTSSILAEIKNAKTLSAALISCFVLFPLITFLAAKLFFNDNPDFMVGLCILATMPVTIASGTVMTQIARGNVTLSLLICVACNLVAIFTIPFSLSLLLQFDQEISLPVSKMIRSLFIMVFVPTFTGQVLRIKVKDYLARCQPYFSIFSQLIVLLIILSAFSSSTSGISQLGFRIIYIFALTIGLHVIYLVLNFSISKLLRLDRASTAAFTIHTSQKTLTVTSVVWSGYFAGFAMGLIPAVVYHLTQMLIDTFVAHRFAGVETCK